MKPNLSNANCKDSNFNEKQNFWIQMKVRAQVKENNDFYLICLAELERFKISANG